MARKFNHKGKYGHNAIGKDRYRNVENPDKLFRAVDLSDFQFNKGSVGVTDIDGCINLGGKLGQINVFIEFKEEDITNKLPISHRHEAIPDGQRIALENLANGIQMSNAFYNQVTPDFRAPGTASVILLVSHPDNWYPSGAEGIVEKVYWANDALSKNNAGWQVPVGEGKPPISLAQYLDALSALLHNEAPEVRATKLFRGIGKSGLEESGQKSRLIP